jgi:hypothetical protein
VLRADDGDDNDDEDADMIPMRSNEEGRMKMRKSSSGRMPLPSPS